MIPLPLPLLMYNRTGNDRYNNNTINDNNNMPAQQPVNTVTISLDEYNDMKQSLNTLHNALEDNKVIIRDTPYSRAYMTCQTFTRDTALNKVAERYYELEERYKKLQQDHEALVSELHELTSTRWYRLREWLIKCNLLRK